VVRREAVINRTEDLDVKICKEAITRKVQVVHSTGEAVQAVNC
jgi:hypothetical protein